MPIEARPLAPWAAPVTDSCGRGRADAHTPYSCQFPCWDPSRACFLHERVGSGWGAGGELCRSLNQGTHRPQGREPWLEAESKGSEPAASADTPSYESTLQPPLS